MDSAGKGSRLRQRAAALVIVLAFVVLLLGLSVAYLSRTTSDRQGAHTSFHQSKVDELAQSAMDSIIGDLRQEITNGSIGTLQADGTTVYMPNSSANMVAQRSGSVAGVPNLVRRSVRSDALANNPAPPSRASAVNSTTDASANGRFVTAARWNTHYLIPKKNTATDDSVPVDAFGTGTPPATPDWVFLNNQGSITITAPSSAVIGRYAYAVYDESGLLDMNVAGYPTDPSTAPIPTQRLGRKGSTAFADLSALGAYPISNPDASGVYQVDRLVGWRNYATTQPTNNFPVSSPAGQAFARNFQTSVTPATSLYNFVINNTSGFLTARSDVTFNARTDQMFLGRKELIGFRNTVGTTTSFSTNTLQYLSSFSREANAPSFSPSTPAGSTIDYATLAANPAATPVNPNFLFRRVTTSFTRFDGTTAAVGEPLVKTRFPLSRLAWITYKGPSASLATTDPVYTALVNAGVSTATIQAGTAANIKTCFGLTFPTGGTAGSPWTYTNPSGTTAASRILRLDEVAAAAREPDFFELLQAAILSGSLGQNTGGGVTGGNVFPDVHMSNTTHHILSIGAAMIDQADPDSIPTRIQFNPSGTVWTAYGVENLPYMTQLYPIAGTSPDDPTKWATYLLFQLWNPHQNVPTSLAAPVRLRVDGGIGIFQGGNNEVWTGSSPTTLASGQSVTLSSSASFSAPAPLSNQNTPLTTAALQGQFGALPAPPIPTPTP